jgi:hypothetical protein
VSRVISTTVEHLPSGGTCTTIEWEGGFKVHQYRIVDAVAVEPTPSNAPRYQPGNAGYRRAMRIIDAKVNGGEITPEEARQMEEDYITQSDREGSL